MNFFKDLFNKSKHLIECPRCLGKGHVDQDDIKRLGQELRWTPGPCAYCSGAGKVDAEMVDKVAIDEAYLTADLSARERKLFINGNPDAIERGDIIAEQMDDFIKDVNELHFVRKLGAEQIAQLYMESAPELSVQIYAEEKAALIKYIQKVITLKN